MEGINVEEAKGDPILDEFRFCEECEKHVLTLIIYIRQLENAQVVAKEALETMNLAHAKISKEVELLRAERADLREKLDKKKEGDLKKKMQELDYMHQRFVNRSKI